MEEQARHQAVINNAFYDSLKEGWYSSDDHPIALLRAENKARIPWIASQVKARCHATARILDVGCGGGFLTNHLASEGHEVVGIDLSQSSLDVARRYDKTKRVSYMRANAYDLPFAKASFDVVCAMDILEHVEDPGLLILQASRVLRPGGLFFFHTFNRNWLSYILVIKGVDWFVKNAPKNMHVYHLFLKPQEVRGFCSRENLQITDLVGLVPDAVRPSFWKMLVTRKVPSTFSFRFVKSLMTGYCGIAHKLV